MIIVIPLEISIREYLPKLLLSYSILKQTDFKIIIGNYSKIFQKIKTFKNCVIIEKSISTIKEKNTIQLAKNGNKILVLDEEGPISHFENFTLLSRIPKNIFSKLHTYLIWGDEDKKKIFNIIKFEDKDKLKCFGHPKYELLKKPFNSLFDNEVKKIKKKYKNFVFIPSSFSFFDSHQFQNDNVSENVYFRLFLKRFITSNKLNKEYEVQKSRIKDLKENYDDFLDLLMDISKKKKNFNFVLRPHPLQDINKIRKRLKKKPKNLHVVYKYSVTPWIIACKYYLHTGCSSYLEASILKKRIIFFIKNFYKNHNFYHKKFSTYFNNRDMCTRYLLKNLEKSNLEKKIPSELHKIVKNCAKDNFNLLLINHISKIKMKSDYKLYQKSDFFIKIILKKFISYIKNNLILKSSFLSNFLKPHQLLTKEYKDKKFSKASLKKIQNDLNKFAKIDKENIKFQINEIGESVFEIRKIAN
jgi:surface carbohydrate biosynthesis protein